MRTSTPHAPGCICAECIAQHLAAGGPPQDAIGAPLAAPPAATPPKPKRARKEPRGRPRLVQRPVVRSVTLEAKTWKQVDRVAAKQGLSAAAWIRRLVTDSVRAKASTPA